MKRGFLVISLFLVSILIISGCTQMAPSSVKTILHEVQPSIGPGYCTNVDPNLLEMCDVSADTSYDCYITAGDMEDFGLVGCYWDLSDVGEGSGWWEYGHTHEIIGSPLPEISGYTSMDLGHNHIYGNDPYSTLDFDNEGMTFTAISSPSEQSTNCEPGDYGCEHQHQIIIASGRECLVDADCDLEEDDDDTPRGRDIQKDICNHGYCVENDRGIGDPFTCGGYTCYEDGDPYQDFCLNASAVPPLCGECWDDDWCAGYATCQYGVDCGYGGGICNECYAAPQARSTIICSELNRQGYLSSEHMAASGEYSAKHLDRETMLGYHYWAEPLVEIMAKDKEVTNKMIPIGVSWGKHMAYEMGIEKEDDDIGRLINKIAIPLNREIGVYLIENDAEDLRMSKKAAMLFYYKYVSNLPEDKEELTKYLEENLPKMFKEGKDNIKFFS